MVGFKLAGMDLEEEGQGGGRQRRRRYAEEEEEEEEEEGGGCTCGPPWWNTMYRCHVKNQGRMGRRRRGGEGFSRLLMSSADTARGGEEGGREGASERTSERERTVRLVWSGCGPWSKYRSTAVAILLCSSCRVIKLNSCPSTRVWQHDGGR